MKNFLYLLCVLAICISPVAAQSFVTGVIPQYAGGIVTATTGSTIANASINTQGNFTIPVPSNPTSHVMTFTPPSNTPYSPFSLTVTAGPGTTNITAQIQAVVPQIGINIGIANTSSVATDSNGNAIPGAKTLSASTSPLSGALMDLNFLQGSGTTVTDLTANHNDGTIISGTTWTTQGLTFGSNDKVNLPTSVNRAQTWMFAIYLPPYGNNTQNFPAVLTSSAGPNGGLNLSTSPLAPAGNNLFGANGFSTYFAGWGASTNVLYSGWHTLTYVLGTSPTPDLYYLDGIVTDTQTNQTPQFSGGNQTTGNLAIGVAAGTFTSFVGTMYRATAWDSPLTAAQVLAASRTISIQDMPSRGVATSPTPVPVGGPAILGSGDSIMVGIGTNNPWINNLSLTNQPGYTVHNFAISGITSEEIDSNDDNMAALYCKSSLGPSNAIFMEGTNSFQDAVVGTTSQIVFSYAAGWAIKMKSAGCRIFIGTMISRGGTDGTERTYDASKDEYDGIILSQAKSVGFDGVIDFAANPLLGADGAYGNSTYFQSDQTHPTNAGQTLMANAASNALNYYFGYSQANPHLVTTATYTMLPGDGYVTSNPTANSILTLPDCTGPSGAMYTVANLQSTFTVSVISPSSTQLISGLPVDTSVAVPSNGSLILHIVPNPKNISGCHWEK